MKLASFRYCMIIGALALIGLALFYFMKYVELSIALNNNGLQPGLKDYIRALWLAFACQALLIGSLYALVAWKPHAVSREVIVIFGLLQLVEAGLLFSFAGSGIAAALLLAAAFFVMLGSALWPKRLPPGAPAGTVTPAGTDSVR
jgi:hypothetical protein